MPQLVDLTHWKSLVSDTPPYGPRTLVLWARTLFPQQFVIFDCTNGEPMRAAVADTRGEAVAALRSTDPLDDSGAAWITVDPKDFVGLV